MQLAGFHHCTSRGPSQAVSSSSPPNWSHGVLPHSAAGIHLPRDAISGYPDPNADSPRHRHLYVRHRARSVHRSGSLRRAPPARPQAATGAASVLQAGELLRGPQGPTNSRPARPDRLWLRRVDIVPAAAGGFAGPDGQSPQRADRGSVCAYNRQARDKDASGDSS